jgi:hypothetical protein
MVRKQKCSYRKRIIAKVLLAVLLWIVAITRVIAAAGKGEAKETLVTAFNQVALKDMNASVESFGYFGNVYLSLEARKNMVREIGYQLGMSNCEIVQERSNDTLVTSICREGANAQTTIRLITREEQITDTVVESHQYVDIDINLQDHVESALYYKQVVADIMENYGITTDVTVNLTGYMDGHVDMAVKNMVADRLIELMDGKIIAENRTEDLYTIYAYTKNVDDSIILGGKKVNLNISSYYDEESGRTCFYVATPLINASY